MFTPENEVLETSYLYLRENIRIYTHTSGSYKSLVIKIPPAEYQSVLKTCPPVSQGKCYTEFSLEHYPDCEMIPVSFWRLEKANLARRGHDTLLLGVRSIWGEERLADPIN